MTGNGVGYGDTAGVQLRPDLTMIDGRPRQAYLLRRDVGVLLVDTGRRGLTPGVEEGLARWDLGRDALTHLVLTHWHPDHAGSAAEIGGWPGVTVITYRRDASVVRGERTGMPPVLTDAERGLWEQVSADLHASPVAHVDVEVEDGDWIEGPGARVIATPGHTDGSLALHVPDAGVLFTGDVVAGHEGALMLGTFNTDREAARRSLRRLGQMPDLSAVCFGHGRPLLGNDATALTQAASADPYPTPSAPDRDAPAPCGVMSRNRTTGHPSVPRRSRRLHPVLEPVCLCARQRPRPPPRRTRGR